MKAILGVRIERVDGTGQFRPFISNKKLELLDCPAHVESIGYNVFTYLHSHWFTLHGWKGVGRRILKDLKEDGYEVGKDFIIRSSFISPSLVRFSDKYQIALFCPLLSALKERAMKDAYRNCF